jgi:Delta7-sterol 5-desaturase
MFAFLLWTLLLYGMHRVAHIIPFLRQYHNEHHRYVIEESTGWNWRNLFLYVDNFETTADQWLLEVIPTLIFSAITGHWWITVFYYFWAAFIQEVVEHNQKFDLFPFLTSGRWHLYHHIDNSKNYGVFTFIWDLIFGTYHARAY